MREPLFTVRVSREDYPNPEIGDREQDEELGPIVVTAVEPDGDGWLVTYSLANDTGGMPGVPLRS